MKEVVKIVFQLILNRGWADAIARIMKAIKNSPYTVLSQGAWDTEDIN